MTKVMDSNWQKIAVVAALIVIAGVNPPCFAADRGGVALVGEAFADLKWDPSQAPHPEEQFRRWEIHRGDSWTTMTRLLPGPPDAHDPNANFYRDGSLQPDTKYYYQLRVIRLREGEEQSYPVFDGTAWTIGLQGKLYRGLTLPAGEYRVGDVHVLPGATLVVEKETTLRNMRQGSVLVFAEGGALEINGATVSGTVQVGFGRSSGDASDNPVSGSGHIRGASFEEYASVHVFGASKDVEISGNTFKGEQHVIRIYEQAKSALLQANSGGVNISVEGTASATVKDNCPPPAECSIANGVGVFNEASATIQKNTLGDMVIVSGTKAQATVKQNVFRVKNYWALRVDSGGMMTAEDNSMEPAQPNWANKLISVQGGAHLIARRNTVLGNVSLGREGGVVTLRDNVIRGGEIRIDDGAAASGEIELNTITSGSGFRFEGSGDYSELLIKHNCIAGNQYGLVLAKDLAKPLDVTENWWGHADGPYHQTKNPEGRGDTIVGNTVDFDDWDRTDVNCRDTPPPPPVPEPDELSVCVGTDAGTTGGRAAGLVCSADPEIIPDGQSRATVQAEVKDDQGRPLPGAVVTFAMARGDPGSLLNDKCTTAADGTCSVNYQAPQPHEVLFGGEGLEHIVIEAKAGSLSKTVKIRLVYLKILNFDPPDGARNVHWEDLEIWAEADAAIDQYSVGARTFEVKTASHPNVMKCDYASANPRRASCRVEWLTDDKDLGLYITVTLLAGPDGILGQGGLFLRKRVVWKFFTLPKLSPRIMPVQTSDLWRYYPTNFLTDKEAVVRVHADLSESTELDWVEANVRLIYNGRDEFTRNKFRFHPGEVPPWPKPAMYLGNSANFYSDPRHTGRNEVPILEHTGATGISVELEPVPQHKKVDVPLYKPTDATDILVDPRIDVTYHVTPIAPQQPDWSVPEYPWRANQQKANYELGGFPARRIVERLLPVVRAQPQSQDHVMAVATPWGQGTQVTRHLLARWARRLDARSGGGIDARAKKKNLIYLIPGDWMRSVNKGDPIYHGPTSHVCLIGSDAPEHAIAHCLAHLHGLRDDWWYFPGTEHQNPFGPDLRGYHLDGDRVVNNRFADRLGPDFTFALMRSSLGLQRRFPNDVWIDLDNYKRLLIAFRATTRSRPLRTPDSAQLTIGGEVVRRDGTESGLLDLAELAAWGVFPSPNGEGDYRVQIVGNDGTVLATHAFTPEFSTLEEGVEYASFLFTVPATEDVHEVRLVRGETVLSSLTASTNAPHVSVTSPSEGTYSGSIEVRWSGGDPDHDTNLQYTVYYTYNDGQSWDPVAIDTTNDEYALDTTEYPSCEKCRIKVVAHDGFHSAEAESATFSVSNPPKITGVWPLDGTDDAAIYMKVRANFRDPMDGVTIDASTFTLTDGQGSPIPGSVHYDEQTYDAVFTADAALEYRKSYTATIRGTITDTSGQQLGSDYVWSFTVERSPFIPPCTGDCNDNSSVTVDELVKGVNIALGTAPMEECEAFDSSGDGTCTVDELVKGVNHALGGCPVAEPTATATTAATPTPTTPEIETPMRTATPTSAATTAPSSSATPLAATSTPSRTPTAPAPIPTSTATPTPTPTESSSRRVYCDTLNAPLLIPDGAAFPAINDIVIHDNGVITDLDVQLHISHTWVGDLIVHLNHQETARNTVLLDRPGLSSAPDVGCDENDVSALINDAAALSCDDQCNAGMPAIAGSCRPSASLSVFNGDTLTGTWSLTVADEMEGDSGFLNEWCLEVTP